MVRRVEISRRAEKQLRKVPQHIGFNLMIWVTAVEFDGLEVVGKVPGYHDEPLKGALKEAGAPAANSWRTTRG